MAIYTEGKHAGHFIISEEDSPGYRSREAITVQAGQNLQAGQVLAIDAATGHYIAAENDETSAKAVGVLFDNVDATDGELPGVAIVRDAVVNGKALVWADTEDTGDRDQAVADLLLVNIIVRGSVAQ